MVDPLESGIRVEIRGPVGIVTMQSPPHNFLSLGLTQKLAETLEAMQQDTKIGCAVLAADGSSFCAGADFSTTMSARDMQDEILQVYETAARLFEVTLPIVGAIHGPAVGGGLGLAMIADIRLASPEARFVANFSQLGIHQGFGLRSVNRLKPTQLVRLLGPLHGSPLRNHACQCHPAGAPGPVAGRTSPIQCSTLFRRAGCHDGLSG